MQKLPNVLLQEGACFALGQDYVNGVPIETTRGVGTV